MDPVPDVYVRMVRRHMRDIPQCAFPAGYGMRPMRLEDAGLWEDCQRDAEPILTIEPGLFMQAFGEEPDEIPRRVFLITNPRGLAVGTIGAWLSHDFEEGEWGRIHWVSVRPSEQGKGLMKAAMTSAMNLLAQWHDRAWLDTSSGRLGAIKVYLDFGFELDMTAPKAEEAKVTIERGLCRKL